MVTAELSTLFQAIYFSILCVAFQRRPTLLASRIPQYQRLAHIDVNLAGNFDRVISRVSSVSSVSSDKIVGEPETAWTEELAAIPAREFNAAGAALGCTFVLPKEANEFDFLKQFFPLQLILIVVSEMNEYAQSERSQKLD